MYKCFNLQVIRNISPNLCNFFNGQFPRRNHSFGTKSLPEKICLVIDIIALCTNMNFYLRAHLSCNGKYTRIGNDQRIRSDFMQLPEILAHPLQITVMRSNICRYKNTFSMFMCETDSLCHILHREIFSLYAKSIHFSTDINRICTVHYCHFQHFQAACRYQ